MYRTNVQQVVPRGGLGPDAGWVDMVVRFLVDEASAGAKNFTLGWTVFPPGARHERHLHRHCDEFFVVLKGRGEIYTDTGREPAAEGDVVYVPRGGWHGFVNTGAEDAVLVWGWIGAGSLEASGYEVAAERT
jgi:mannose-6-phosphate isomerase-like protein (cupin superfamily)